MRPSLLLLLLLLWPAPPAHSLVLHFDEVAAGTVLDELYAPNGVHLSAVGGSLGPVIAAVPCEGEVSPPNALSYQAVGQCPAVRDEVGWLQADFDAPQDVVRVAVVPRSADTVAYLQAYGPDGFLEVAWSRPGDDQVGRTQILEVSPPPDRSRIVQVRFGVYRFGGTAWFDDLDFDVAVPAGRTRLGAFKAAWR